MQMKFIYGGYFLFLLVTTKTFLLLFSLQRSQKLIFALLQVLPVLSKPWVTRFFSSRWAAQFTCLPKAVLVQQIYLRNGLISELCFGIQAKGGGPDFAHAWVNVPSDPTYNFQALPNLHTLKKS